MALKKQKRVYRRRQSIRRRTRRRGKSRRSRKLQHGGGQPPEYITPGAKIMVIISSDKEKPTLDALLQSLQRHRFSYKVVGYGRPWLGFETKMANLLEGISRSKDSPYVMILDGFDTLAIKDCEEVVAAIQSRPRAQLPILFSAETICGGNCDEGIRAWHVRHRGEAPTVANEKQIKHVKDQSYKESASPYFLNSGCIVGPPNDMEWLFKSMIVSPSKDDQLAAAHVVIRNLERVDLDIEEKVFRNKMKREKIEGEGTPAQSPGILHYPGMRDEERQARLLELYKQYS